MKNNINDIGNLFKESFEGYTTNPSPAVWSGIKSKLWLTNFLNFGIASFNIYYAAIIVAAVSFTGYSVLNNNSEIVLHDTEEASYISETETEMRRWLICDENPQRITFNTKTQEINKPLSIVENKITKSKDINLKVNNTRPNNSFDQQKVESTKLRTNNKGNKQIEKKSEINSQNIYKENIVALNTKLKEKKEKSRNVEDIKSENIPISNNSAIDLKTSSQHSLTDKNSRNKIANVDEDIYDTIFVTITDTVKYTDTIEVFDTIPFQEAMKKMKRNNRNKFEGLSVDIFTGIQNSSYTYMANDEMLDMNLNSSSSSAMSFVLGANVNYEIDKWNIQTGISYMQLVEDFNYLEEINTIDTTGSFWEYQAIGYTHSFDTVGYEFQIDELNGDTFYVYVPMIIDSITPVFDSTKIYSTEINNSIISYNIRNKYTYLNIPVMFGYSFYENKKMTLTGKLGGNIGLLLNAKGKTFSLLDSKSVNDFNESTLPFLKTNFSWVVGLNMYYKIEKNMGVFVEPYFRGNLNSMFDKSLQVCLKSNGIGLIAGFRFYL